MKLVEFRDEYGNVIWINPDNVTSVYEGVNGITCTVSYSGIDGDSDKVKGSMDTVADKLQGLDAN